MKFRVLKSILLSTILSAVGFFTISSNALAFEQIVATVNGAPILESQVQRALGKKANTPTNRQKALESIIDEMLVQKAIQESGVKVTPAQVDRAVREVAAQNGLTYGQLLDALDYQGISLKQYRQNIAQQMLMAEVRNRTIGQNLEVTREQVEALAQQLLAQAKKSGDPKLLQTTHYQVRHILLKLNPLLNDAQAKAQLEQIRQEILSGKMTFAEAAKKYSKDYLSGANGGDLGFAAADNYSPAFAQQVVKTKPKQISAPFKTEFGWHILQVTGERQGEVSENAFRQKAYQILVNQQLQEDAKDWVKVLRKGADIRILAQ